MHITYGKYNSFLEGLWMTDNAAVLKYAYVQSYVTISHASIVEAVSSAPGRWNSAEDHACDTRQKKNQVPILFWQKNRAQVTRVPAKEK